MTDSEMTNIWVSVSEIKGNCMYYTVYVFICFFTHLVLNITSLFFSWIYFSVFSSSCLVASTSALHCLERFIYEITSYVSGHLVTLDWTWLNASVTTIESSYAGSPSCVQRSRFFHWFLSLADMVVLTSVTVDPVFIDLPSGRLPVTYSCRSMCGYWYLSSCIRDMCKDISIFVTEAALLCLCL